MMRYLRFPVIPLAFLTGVLFLLSACSSEEVSDELLEIRMISGINHILAESRGAGVITDNLEEDLAVSFVRTDQSPGGSYPSDHSGINALSADINKNNNRITIYPIQYYLPDKGETRLIGWYPAQNQAGGGQLDSSSGTVTFPAIDGSTDILITQPVYGSRIIGKQFSTVSFSHALTQAQVLIKADDAEHAKEYWGKISDIYFVGKEQPCILTLPAPNQTPENANVTFAPDKTGGAGNLKMRAIGKTEPHEDLTLTNEYIAVGYAMFAPHPTNDTNAELDIKIITTKGGEHTITIPYDDKAPFHAGKTYSISLSFKLMDIELDGIIEPWEPAPDEPEPIPVG